MTVTNTLPDPVYQSEFYDGIALKRLSAWVLDTIIVTAITLLVGLLTLSLAWIFFAVFFAVINFVYRWLTLRSGSATWGMRIMAMEIRNTQGARLSGGEAALHTLGFVISMTFIPLQLISMALMAFGPSHKGLHDLALGTAAINRPG